MNEEKIMLNDEELQARINNFLHRKETQFSAMNDKAPKIEGVRAGSSYRLV